MLPLPLIALLLQASAFLLHCVHAQSSQSSRPSSSSTSTSSLSSPSIAPPRPSSRLSLNSLTSFSSSNLPSPPVFSIPSSEDAVSITLASCSLTQSSSPTRFFVSNESTISDPGPDDLGNQNVAEIVLDDTGLGVWTGQMQSGGVLSVLAGSTGSGQQSFELGVSTTGPMHTNDESPPLLGDTTSNQVLLFSPPFAPPPHTQPAYPNYTLPSANITFPAQPADPPNYHMFIAPTSSSTGVPQTGCALRVASSSSASGGNGAVMVGVQQSEGLWLRDDDGWRWQWLVQGLTPLTNYTVLAVLDGTRVSQEIMFVTKSGAFSCPLVHSLPYCPRIAYAIPLAPPPSPKTAHDASTLPSTLTNPILTYLTNFTTSLLTHPCGRDLYSPLVTCADCQDAYRKWLCTISFPRCSEARPDDPTGQGQNQTVRRRHQQSLASSLSSSLNIFGSKDKSQVPVSALTPQPSSVPPRNPNLPAFSSNYNMLLPCLETCTAVDRACPVMLGFQCPVKKFTASMSYGVGFVDSGEDGEQGGGITGALQDRFGNVWCNEG